MLAQFSIWPLDITMHTRLKPLYAYDALEPHIDVRTMEIRPAERHSNEACRRMVASLAVAIKWPADEIDYVRNALP